jgi:hypothetical protein
MHPSDITQHSTACSVRARDPTRTQCTWEGLHTAMRVQPWPQWRPTALPASTGAVLARFAARAPSHVATVPRRCNRHGLAAARPAALTGVHAHTCAHACGVCTHTQVRTVARCGPAFQSAHAHIREGPLQHRDARTHTRRQMHTQIKCRRTCTDTLSHTHARGGIGAATVLPWRATVVLTPGPGPGPRHWQHLCRDSHICAGTRPHPTSHPRQDHTHTARFGVAWSKIVVALGRRRLVVQVLTASLPVTVPVRGTPGRPAGPGSELSVEPPAHAPNAPAYPARPRTQPHAQR